MRSTKQEQHQRRARSLAVELVVFALVVLVIIAGAAAVVSEGAFLPPKPTYLIRTLEMATLTNTPTITPFPATLMTVQGPTMRIRAVSPTPEVPNTLIPLARSPEPSYTPKNQR